jgi:superfamily I DNA/RNA helicase
MEEQEFWQRLNNFSEKLVNSDHCKKLIVAGPGTGKTTSFKKILAKNNCSKNDALVVTFINNLKNDLDKELSGQSSIYTFHGYCLLLLKTQSSFRVNISDSFHYYPLLAKIINSDWPLINPDQECPKFIELIRKLKINKSIDFFIKRANYYDATGYDDSVLRVYALARKDRDLIPSYKQIIVDEFQDFNLLEAKTLELLAEKSPILIAGDDDQALYCNLRFSDPSIIRSLHLDNSYNNFELPYCMRCTEVIVDTVNDLVAKAKEQKKLENRVEKTFDYFPPKKQIDSERFPKINLINCSIQRKNPPQNNFFARFIEKEIKKIPEGEIKEAQEGNYPTVLIIGPKQYCSQITEYLKSKGLNPKSTRDEPEKEICREDGLKLLRIDPNSNLGWRILIECDKPKFLQSAISATNGLSELLRNFIDKDYQRQIFEEIEKYQEENDTEISDDLKEKEIEIVITSFEGSKGLSAQRVFIVGLHNGDIPKDKNNIKDIEICRLLVALTRTRKNCSILYTNNFGGNKKEKSIFIDWINQIRFDKVKVDKNYW